MRLDKFLKVSRLIKRRTVANEACDAGRVTVNGQVAKASVKVKPGDIIEGGGPRHPGNHQKGRSKRLVQIFVINISRLSYDY